jgi:hypothetical protein
VDLTVLLPKEEAFSILNIVRISSPRAFERRCCKELGLASIVWLILCLPACKPTIAASMMDRSCLVIVMTSVASGHQGWMRYPVRYDGPADMETLIAARGRSDRPVILVLRHVYHYFGKSDNSEPHQGQKCI